MEAREFDWHNGHVLHWDLGPITREKAIELQYDDLKEDLAQVAFGASVLLDVGWYPDFSPEGRFVIVVVRDQEWEEPILRLECKDVAGLYQALRAAIEVARR